MTENSSPHAWWASLRHGGLLIAPSRLEEYFSEPVDPLPLYLADRLRADLTHLRTGTSEARRVFLGTVLERVCGVGPNGAGWSRGADVDARWSRRSLSGDVVRPRRVWEGPARARLLVFVDDEPRLGVGRGRRSVSRVVEWLRAAGEKIALVTNHHQFRLVYAGLDYEAWTEWDTDLWFEEGRPSDQVEALRALVGPHSLIPSGPGNRPRLLAAIEESRRGQSEVSSALGERVRRAVESLIQEHGPALGELGAHVPPRDIYIAATRVVMRLVVVLFAEARDLLPRDNPVYHASYGVQGLREMLERSVGTAGFSRLRNRFGAWPRLLALFRLIHGGSHHADLPIPRYGGGLFAPGDTPDPISGALAVFENPQNAPSDDFVYRLLDLLCRTEMKIRQGRVNRVVPVPVDFSDLSSEYIGILYEGLLDYELRSAASNDPMVFLAVGDEPALPLSRLEAMEDAALASLLEKLKQSKEAAAPGGDEEEDADPAEEPEPVDDLLVEADEDASVQQGDPVAAQGFSPAFSDDQGPEDRPETPSDQDLIHRERARLWARRAVIAGKLVPKPRGSKPEALREHSDQVDAVAARLITRIVMPGEWFLVLWGGTRKGSGTFYTPPQLAVPTVQRTLRPLAYHAPPVQAGGAGGPGDDAPAADWIPKTPEQILALKVCDPAVGSGSFAVAALRFLTEALWRSLLHHGWLVEQHDRFVVHSEGGRPPWFGECVKDLPVAGDDAEHHIRARLRRLVVEQCLYGVDLDPLAIELSRLSLWVETMDRDLPFEFLDHKFKGGNSLVGCWFDRFRDYPVLAWEREGGDKTHAQFVHHFRELEARGRKKKDGATRSGDVWTRAIKDRKVAVKRTLAEFLAGQGSFFDRRAVEAPEALHDQAVALFAEMHGIPIQEPDRRAEFYRKRIVDHAAYRQLREAFDTWCATWFWPPDRIDLAPLPKDFAQPSGDARAVVEELREQYRFFHWELEFPDVFANERGGFDAIVGNPPWEIQKPNSKEFFSNVDPLYRTYGKQEALEKQRDYFRQRADDERQWIAYCARYKALSNWCKHAGAPFGDPQAGEGFSLGRNSDALHEEWRTRRAAHRSYADSEHPFQHQGSADINTYKMFLEQGHALLRIGGHLGVVLPSRMYSDRGASGLRGLLMTRHAWTHLYAFQNERRVFAHVHHASKVAIVSTVKGLITEAVATRFRLGVGQSPPLEDLERDIPDTNAYLRVPASTITRFSPRSRAFLEIVDSTDLALLEKIYSNSVRLGDAEGWGVTYATEFHMTADSKLFQPRPWWEARGYEPDEYGRWLKFYEAVPVERHPAEVGWIHLADGIGVVRESEIEDVALPLYEGRMIGQFDFSEKGWLSGKGRKAVWKEIFWPRKTLQPQFLVAASTREAVYLEEHIDRVARRSGKSAADEERERLEDPVQYRAWRASLHPKIGFMDVTAATNSRTMIAALLEDDPAGNSVPVLYGANSVPLAAVLNSLVYDFAARARCAGLHLNYFVIDETPVIRPTSLPLHVTRYSCRLLLGAPRFAPTLVRHRALDPALANRCALTPHERKRLRCVLDAVIAELYGLDVDDLRWILRGCDAPAAWTKAPADADAKGFWRVE